LAGGVAHDLNNVLSGMVSYPDLLLFDMPENNPMRKPLEMIRHTGNKAAAIVQDLLAMTRRGVRTLGVVNLNEAVEEYLTSPEFTELKKRHPKVVVETDLADDLMNIKGSSMHLRKALMNLALNAAEAQPGGGRITLKTENYHMDQPSEAIEQMGPGDYVRLTISDQGTGIAADDLKHIFEPFFTRKIMGRSGTGLGMAIVWGTVQDHDGFISVQSQEGHGTIFDLYFPIARDAVVPAQDKETVDNLLGSWQTILVVDDVAEQREIAVQILKRLRYRPLTASSGEEAIQIFEQLNGTTIDALILDMIMPLGLDGLDTYRSILQIAPHTKAVITSGYSETERVREALNLGAGAYLKKPYMIQEIGVALKKLLAEPAPVVEKAANA
jgi:CheY-like chemotaxis protein